MTRHILLVPSLACPATCAYCFGPHQGGLRMDQRTLRQVAAWISSQASPEPLELTFHGGEPLTAGKKFFQAALPLLSAAWSGRPVRFTLQSNLWGLDDEYLDLFSAYPVSIGTSLDGPEAINDAQRGKGYFQRTMSAIDRARARGIPVGCIATFTAQSAPRWREVAEFFIAEGLSFSTHAALPVLGQAAAQPWVLTSEGYGHLMCALLDFYLENLKRVRISSLDAVIRSVSRGKGGMCTFGDCLGGYLAVGPDGSVYPCQRFAGSEPFRLGGVVDAYATLSQSAAWGAFAMRQQQIDRACEGCEFLDVCRGGCPYNVLANRQATVFGDDLRDPYCKAYQALMRRITDLATTEFFSEANLAQVIDAPDERRSLLQKGRVLELMSNRPHPFEIGQNARQAVAVVALAISGTAEDAANRLSTLGLAGDTELTRQALRGLHERLTTRRTLRNNLYLHVTLTCPSGCSHCYAESGRSRNGAFPPDHLELLAGETAHLGFRHLVITGGEPLAHPDAPGMLAELARLRDRFRPLRTVLRTSLYGHPDPALDGELLSWVASATDEVVVSLDGDRTTHDARRGAGSYDRVVERLQRLVEIGGSAEISLAAVLPIAQAQGAPGQQVRRLADELGIRRVRMRPILPLGRAARTLPDLEVQAVWAHLRPEERLAYGFLPAASCGIGQNLYVEPDGSAYPCYAWHGAAWKLGNVLDMGGVIQVVTGSAFKGLMDSTVDSNPVCHQCALRYLCGGACRAWSRLPGEAQSDLNAPPSDCAKLRERALAMVLSARDYLELDPDRWVKAGFPIV